MPGNLRAVRPEYGLAPKYYNALLGQQVKRDVAEGQPVEWGILKGGCSRSQQHLRVKSNET